MACTGSGSGSGEIVSSEELFNRAPVFISTARVNSPENTSLIQFTPEARDSDENNTLTYSLSDGVDKSLFSFNSNTLELQFLASPDFEKPLDSNKDNTYELEFLVFDGFASAKQAMQILVVDVAEKPSFTSANALNSPEYVRITEQRLTAVSNFTGATLTYSVTGGADQAKLSIDSTSGLISFSSTPDFEIPGDADGDNIYELEVNVSNGFFNAQQLLTLTLTDSFSPITSFTVDKGNAKRSLKFDWALLDADLPDQFSILSSTDGTQDYQVLTGAESIDKNLRTIELVIPLHLTNFNETLFRLEERTTAGDTLVESDPVNLSELNSSADLIDFLKASNATTEDEFGYSTVLSGDGLTLAVSSHAEDSNATLIDGDEGNNDPSTENSGAVFIYVNSSGTWQKQAYIKASNTGQGDFFGLPVALSEDGNTLAVSAHLEDSDSDGINSNEADDSALQSGAVYIYVRNGVTWSKQAYIKASNSDAGDFFGIAIDLSDDGNTLVVGASNESSDSKLIGGSQNNDASQSGAAYVFVRSASSWSQQAYIKATNTGVQDNFGRSVALDGLGNTLVVGAPLEDSNAQGVDAEQNNNDAENSGSAYVFTRNATSWTQQAYLKADNSGAEDLFAQSASLSADGNTLLLGAPGESAASLAGQVDAEDNSAVATGAAYIFTRLGEVWTQQAYLKATEAKAGDAFGFASALSGDGDTAVLGAYLEDSESLGVSSLEDNVAANDAGAAYVFQRNDDVWRQVNYLKASNTESNDHFSRSVSIAKDGQSLAVGAEGESSQAPASDANQLDNSQSQSGAVYIY